MIGINSRRQLNVKCDLLRAERLEVVLIHTRQEVFNKLASDSGTQRSHSLRRLVVDHALSYLTGYGCIEHQGFAAGPPARSTNSDRAPAALRSEGYRAG